MSRTKIAIIHPRLVVGGGSEAKPLWILETLKDDYVVYLITMGEVDLKRLNSCYGTNLKSNQFNIISLPIPRFLRKRFDALRSYRLARYCKKHASEFDLMISTYNTMDFGQRGIQCIADFSFDDRLRQTFDILQPGLKGLFYKSSPLRWIYLKIGEILAGNSKDGWKKNLTIANSDWSGKIMIKIHGIKTKTVYPPVASTFPGIPWSERENGFVVLARLTPEKRIDKVMEILKRVRERGYNIHLHILGRFDDSSYARTLRELCEKNSDWSFMEGLMIGQKKLEFIARHKFSISGRENEPFGIAVAEAVKAGCIVWVPNGGGQVEIVDHPDLIYDSVEDAVNKIEKVLKNDGTQVELQKNLVRQAEKFSVERFRAEIRNIVQQFLEEKSEKVKI